MKLTKYIHSCVLLENGGEKLLIDPGMFTFAQGVPPDTFGGVSTVIITHTHPDHLDIDNLKKILELSGAKIVANDEIKKALEDAGVIATVITDTEYETGQFKVEAIPADHEQILADSLPENYGYLINGTVLAVGDSFAQGLKDLTGVQVLMLPVMAPWLTELQAFEFGKAVGAKRIVPVHDGYAKDFFLKSRYDNYAKNFLKEGITFEPLMNAGDSIDI